MAAIAAIGFAATASAFTGLLPPSVEDAAAQDFEMKVTVGPVTSTAGDGVAAGGTFDLSVTLDIEEAWHVYGIGASEWIPTTFTLNRSVHGFVGGVLKESPDAHEVDLIGDGVMIPVHEGTVTLTLPVDVADEIAAGEHTLTGTIGFQACDDRRCLPPESQPFSLTVNVIGDAPAPFKEGEEARIKSARFAGPVDAGSKAAIDVEWEIAEGWHLYAQRHEMQQPPTFTWTLPEGVTVKGALIEVTEPHELEFYGDMVFMHETRAVIRQEFDVAATVASGEYPVTASVTWQHCNELMCVPTAVDIAATLVIGVGGAGGAGAPAGSGDSGGDSGGDNAGAADVPAAQASTHLSVKSARFAGPTHRGKEAVLEIEVSIADGAKLWSPSGGDDAAKIKWIGLPGGIRKGDLVVTPAPSTAEIDGADRDVHEGTVTLRQSFTVGEGTGLGTSTFKGTGTFNVTVGGKTSKQQVPLEAELEVATTGVTGARIGQAFVLGLITLLTPCVFPLLPVTVSFFSKQEGPVLFRSVVYGLGIVFTITVIGLIFKSSLDVFARGVWFNMAVGTLFIALALSLFGMFDMRLPSFLIDGASKRSRGGGLMGAFFMAVTLAMTSFSCSLPFLAALFQDFEQGDQFTAVVLLVIYSCTMAAPFVACSLFPALMKSMPSAGGWMNAIKVTMGFVEFALAFKFFRGAAIAQGWEFLPRAFVYALWIGCAISAALYLFGYITLPHDTKVESIGVVRALFAVLFLSMAFYMLPGTFGRPVNAVLDAFILTPHEELWLPEEAGGRGGGGGGGAAHDGSITASNNHGEWPKNDWDGALARAAARGVPVLFDFTGVG